jgi:hypothetical protein
LAPETAPAMRCATRCDSSASGTGELLRDGLAAGSTRNRSMTSVTPDVRRTMRRTPAFVRALGTVPLSVTTP